MSQDFAIKLKCSQCKEVNYWTRKNSKLIERKIEFKKFCKHCRAHTLHNEAAKKSK